MIEQLLISLSKISQKSFLGKLIRFFLGFLPKRSVVRIRVGINKGMRWTVGSGLGIVGACLGTREIEAQLALTRHIKEGMTIFDIGAHRGFYTLGLARLVGKLEKFMPSSLNPIMFYFCLSI